MTLILGIDEAARGPVIGPLAIVGFMIDEKDLPKLDALGVKDSKLLPIRRIDELAKKLKKFSYKLILVEPEEIDSAVDGNDGMNLNWLEAKKTAEIINELKPDKVFVDCPSTNIKAYTSYLRELLKKKDTEIIAEHKADVKYKVVSAASIIAKSAREEEVRKIEKKLGCSIGSGYPSNLVCQKFLGENWDKHPELFRKSWESYKRFARKEGQKNLGDF